MSACQHNVSHEYRLYYPAGFRGQAEPIRMLLEELNIKWREPFAELGLSEPEKCFEEFEKMRTNLKQEVKLPHWD